MRRYPDWAQRLVFEVAAETGWSHSEILGLPAEAGFYYAMLATRQRYDRMEGARLAATFAWMEEDARQRMLQQIGLVLSGPGRIVDWKDGLTEKQLAALDESQRELDATYEMLKQRGLLCNPTGGRSILSMLKRG